MARHLGLARIACPCCGADQLVAMNELVEGTAVQCSACGEPETALSVLGRHPELAELATLLRELHAMRSGRFRRPAGMRGEEEARASRSKEPA